MKYPDEGELFLAKQKKSDHLIFFVHFYQGNKRVLMRHVKLVNELGYDAYAFNIKDDLDEHYFVPYSHVSDKFGMKHAIADQIEEHLDLLPEYKTKIAFAFSNIAGCAIEAMARRPSRDVIALVCDSGPGASFVFSGFRLFTEKWNLKTLPFLMTWSTGMHKDIPEHLQELPQNFPVLSIRGWKDKLISPAHIDKIFDQCKNLNWRKLALPEAGHLNGLRDYPTEYRSGLENFFESI